MIHENIEGLTDWNIPIDHLDGRRPGISAMMRVKDEAQFLRASVGSIAWWCDEVVIMLQGEQSDGTDRIAADIARTLPHKVRVLTYPFDSLPNGPGHDKQPRGSVYERAYFYNWCLAQTRHQWALKWDGDMVAMEFLGDLARKHIGVEQGTTLQGIDMCSPTHTSKKILTGRDPRLFEVTEQTFYETASHCERFVGPTLPRIPGPTFLHFKWCKPLYSITKAWPDSWPDSEHFRRILREKAVPGERYDGEWPEQLREVFGAS